MTGLGIVNGRLPIFAQPALGSHDVRLLPSPEGCQRRVAAHLAWHGCLDEQWPMHSQILTRLEISVQQCFLSRLCSIIAVYSTTADRAALHRACSLARWGELCSLGGAHKPHNAHRAMDVSRLVSRLSLWLHIMCGSLLTRRRTTCSRCCHQHAATPVPCGPARESVWRTPQRQRARRA